MGFSNLTELRDAVANRLDRVNDPIFLAEFPTLVMMVEGRINQDLFGLNAERTALKDQIPALTDDSSSNWVLASFPQIYLTGVLAQAALAELASEATGTVNGQLFEGALNRLVDDRKAAKLKPAKPGGKTP